MSVLIVSPVPPVTPTVAASALTLPPSALVVSQKTKEQRIPLRRAQVGQRLAPMTFGDGRGLLSKHRRPEVN